MITAPELFVTKRNNVNDIAIVGGGLASLTLAHHLFMHNNQLSIRLFCEDNEVGKRASGNQQGAIYPLLQGSNSWLANFYAECFNAALPYYQNWLPKLHVEHEWCGVLQQAIKPQLINRYKQVAEHWPQWCDWLSVEESNAVAGLDLNVPSLYIPRGGWMNPQQFCQQLTSYLLNAYDFHVELKQKVKPAFTNNQWTINNTNFDCLVLATGHQTPDMMPEYQQYLQSVRGQVSQLHERTELNSLNAVICHKGYLTPKSNNFQTFGATFHKDDSSENIQSSDTEANIAQLKSSYKAVEKVQKIELSDVTNDKVGVRATTKDHLPICGEVFSKQWVRSNVNQNTGKMMKSAPKDNELSGLYVLSGLGARGLTSAPLLAEHLSNIILYGGSNLPQTIQKAVAPVRFLIKTLKQQKNQF